MHVNRLLLLLAGTLALTGCPSQGTTASNDASNTVLKLTPQFQMGGLQVGPPQIQSVISPYSSADVNHLVVQVFTVSNGTETVVASLQQDIPGANLASPVVFEHLSAKTTYRFKAFAYREAGTDAANLISTQEAGSVTDLEVTSDASPVLGTLKVQLTARSYNGQGTAPGVLVSTGSVSSTAEPVTVN